MTAIGEMASCTDHVEDVPLRILDDLLSAFGVDLDAGHASILSSRSRAHPHDKKRAAFRGSLCDVDLPAANCSRCRSRVAAGVATPRPHHAAAAARALDGVLHWLKRAARPGGGASNAATAACASEPESP